MGTDQEWLAAGKPPVPPRAKKLAVVLALAGAAAAFVLHAATGASSSSPPHPSPAIDRSPGTPGRHATVRVLVPSEEPLLDRCAVRLRRNSRGQCFHTADSAAAWLAANERAGADPH